MGSAESLSSSSSSRAAFVGIPGCDLLRFHGADRHRSRQPRAKHSISERMRAVVALHIELTFSTSWRETVKTGTGRDL